jgi:hypothetical protein
VSDRRSQVLYMAVLAVLVVVLFLGIATRQAPHPAS